MTQKPYQYEKTEWEIGLSADYTNPYLQEQVRLDLVLTTPDGQTRTQPCFYMSGGNQNALWKARFTPRMHGEYTGFFRLTLPQNEITSAPVSFTVSPTAGDGFLTANDRWSFQFDSGRPFRGIGENVGWEPRTWENPNHHYDYFLPHLAKNGANYIRTWMGPWNLPLEWGQIVDTDRYTNSSEYFHPGGIARMDQLVEMADSLGIYLMLALDWHGALMTGDRWNINPYNAANGGPASTPADFFSNEEAKKRYKNRLRYLVARWGYSPAIGCWEFFNEIDNAVYNGTENTVAIPHSAVTAWHDEMSMYLRETDPYDHLISTSISHREIIGLFSDPGIDFNQRHLYRVTGNIPSVVAQGSKPMVVGEFGYDWDWNNISDAIGAELDYDFKRGLWYGLFTPTPILPMSWWWEFFTERGTDEYFAAVAEIAHRMELNAAGAALSSVGSSTSSVALQAYAVQAGSSVYVYLLNNSSSPLSAGSISLTGLSGATFELEIFDPEQRSYVASESRQTDAGALSIGQISMTARESRILILKNANEPARVRAPFGESRITFPGTVQAEDFDRGGSLLAYRDLDAENLGGAYRTTEGVDIATQHGRTFVTEMVKGEWLSYSIAVAQSGIYDLGFVYRSPEALGHGVDVLLDGQSLLAGSRAMHATEEWDTLHFQSPLLQAGAHLLEVRIHESGWEWDALTVNLQNAAPSAALLSPAQDTTITLPGTVQLVVAASDADGEIASVKLFAGTEELMLFSGAPYEMEWLPVPGEYTVFAEVMDNDGLSVTTTPVRVVVLPSPAQQPYGGIPHAIPGTIEAEDFDEGAASVAYLDNTPGNIYGQYRPDTDVDLEICTDTGGGFNLADIQPGEWVEYTVNVEEAGNYLLHLRVATQNTNQRFQVLFNDQLKAEVEVPNTGGWQVWRTVTKVVNLMAGEQVMRLAFESEFFNLNHLIFEPQVLAAAHTVHGLSVFPNPFTGVLQVMADQPWERLVLLDQTGRQVAEIQSTTSNWEPQVPAGWYILHVFFADGTHVNVPVIKSKS